MSRLTVAAAQIECRPGDLSANIDLHLQALREAKQARAALVLFPELSLTDYRINPDLPALALDRAAPELVALAKACGETTAIVGFVERDGDRFYNSVATLRDGRVARIHRKINLATYGRLREGYVYAAGHELDIDDSNAWRAATLICADTWNPAIPWLAALKGAGLLLVAVASARDAVDADFDNPGGWEVNLRHTALTYGLPTVMCNHCGCRDGFDFWGGSRIIDAHGGTVAIADSSPQLLVATIDGADTELARKRLPTMRTMDAGLISALLRDVAAPDAIGPR
jgi:predicted amidohydrolase